MAKRSTDPDIQLLAALADPARMEILRELAGSSEVCACDLTTCCDVRQPTVSHHLKVLRDAGAVGSERRGNRVYYWVSPDLNDRIARIMQAIVPGGAQTMLPGLISADALRVRRAQASPPNAADLPAGP